MYSTILTHKSISNGPIYCYITQGYRFMVEHIIWCKEHMAIVRTQEQHSIFTMSNFKENEKKWKRKEKQLRRTGYMLKFFRIFLRRGRMLISRNKLSNADRTTSPISTHGTWIFCETSTTQPLSSTHIERIVCCCRNKPTKVIIWIKSSTFFRYASNVRLLAGVHKTCWLCMLLVYAPHAWIANPIKLLSLFNGMHSPRPNSVRRKLYCC